MHLPLGPPAIWWTEQDHTERGIAREGQGLRAYRTEAGQTMAMHTTIPKSIDDYAARYPTHVRRLIRAMRQTIRAAAPQAQETISYRMPAFRVDGILVYFAAHTSHIGFYPGRAAIVAFRRELSRYKGARGSVQFPFDQALPLGLVRRIVKFRVKDNASKRQRNKGSGSI